MFLDEIVDGVTIENSEFECKARLNREDVLGWLKSVAGFANAEGGDFYVGVEDKTNRLIGFDRQKADVERNYFNNQVNEHLTPRPPYKIDFLRYTYKEKEFFVLKIHVQQSPIRPIILRYKNIPSIYMRREGFTNGASYEEIINMSISSQKAAYDTLISDVRYERSNFKKLLQFFNKHNKNMSLTDKALRSMGFFDGDKMLVNGAVLFQDDYNGGKTSVQCSVFSGVHKGSERIVTINKFDGNITDSIQYMLDFVKQRMNHAIVKLGDGRKNIDAFPERAVFEGIINAIAHRDYFMDGTQVEVDIFADRLQITSPGSFYQGERIKQRYDLSEIISKRRNELICNVLVRCNVMEAAGTGFDKIAEEYKDVDYFHKPYIFSTSDHFSLILPDLTYENGLRDSDLPHIEYVPVPNGSVYDEKIIAFCYNMARKPSDIAEYIGVSDSTHLRKKILDNLVESRYLIKGKNGRSSTYRTNADVVKLV